MTRTVRAKYIKRRLTPFVLTIERGFEIMTENEYLKITPKNVRLQKQFFTETARAKLRRGN